jgi:hypothetical protein
LLAVRIVKVDGISQVWNKGNECAKLFVILSLSQNSLGNRNFFTAEEKYEIFLRYTDNFKGGTVV